MRKESRGFLVRLLDEPGPSNFEAPVQRIWRDYVKPYCDRIESDVYGNQVAVLPGSKDLSVMVVGHADEIGLIIRRVDDEGMLWFGRIGGVDPAILPGTRVRVLSRKGIVPGVIGLPAIHLLPRGETSKAPKVKDLCIDIGAKDRAMAERLVQPGDAVVFGEDFREMAGGFASHRCFDNRMGCWIVAEMMRLLAGRRARKATVYGVSSVQEETGVWGAGLVAERWEPTVAIAVDVCHDTGTPGISKTAWPDIRCGKGPAIGRGVRVNRVLSEQLEKAAKAAKIPVQWEIDEGSTSTDADPISSRRTGIPVGTVSVACRYMHTPNEVIHLGDLEKTATLLAKFVETLGPRTKFAQR